MIVLTFVILVINLIILFFSIYDEYLTKHLEVHKKNQHNKKKLTSKLSLDITKRNFFLEEENGLILRKKILESESEKITDLITNANLKQITFFLKHKGFE